MNKKFSPRLPMLVLAAAFLALAASGSPPVAEARTAPEETRTFTGILSATWVDPRPGSGLEPGVEYTLTGASGDPREVLLGAGDVEAPGGTAALIGEPVEVLGTGTPAGEVRAESVLPDPTPPADAPVQTREAGAEAPAVGGSRPTATILCRFADSTGVTPHEKPFFETLMGGAAPGLDHYWREVSYGKVDLAGSRVFGWYNLPQSKAYYTAANGWFDTQKLKQDCTAAADSDVGFPDYTNINIMVNSPNFPNALGGFGYPLERDGQSKTYGMTFIPQWGYESQSVLAHEMGHSFGLPHSGGPYGNEYDSQWDVMSSGGSNCSDILQPPYGCSGSHTIAHHKDRLGWIPPVRRYVARQGVNPLIEIERLAEPSASGYLLAEIPIAGESNTFYTVEARRFAGYDEPEGAIPGEAIVIHKVDLRNGTGDLEPVARVVDPDNNRNPNDAGAMWLPGETFEAGDISVEVVGRNAGGFSVRATGGAPDTTPPNAEVIYATYSGVTRRTDNYIQYYSEDANATLQCSLDGAAYSACDPFGIEYYAGLSAGVHTFRVRAIDRAGNADPTPGNHTWTVDNTRPTVSPLSPKPGSATRDATPTVRAVVRDTPSALQKDDIKLYVGGKAVRAPKFSYSAATERLVHSSPRLSTGRKTVKIVATDRAGNVATKSWYFTIRR